MKNRGLTANHAKYAKRELEGNCLHLNLHFFRVFRVFRGSHSCFRPGQSLLTSAATLFIFAARTVCAQSSEDIPALRPARLEIPPTLWEQHGVLLVALGIVGLAVLAATIWWLLQPKPTVPVPIEIQTRRELERLGQLPENGTTISQVSQVLKRYVAVAFELSAGEMTTGEFSRAAAGRLLLFLRLLVVALGIVALAGPRFAHDRTETQASGVDIMLALDLSWSMMALDMSGPGERVSRFDIASGVLEDFIRKRENDRIGLVVFSAVPYLASPLTLNHAWLAENLRRMHVGMIRELGTAIGDATAAAAKRLKANPETKSRIIILLTDGDNNKGDIDPVPAAQLAAALGAKVYTIGIGVEEPCKLPLFEPATGKLVLDPNGAVQPTIVLQPANYSILRKMSNLSNARSYRATNRRELQSIYDDIDRLEKTEVKLRRFTTHTPLFQWPLLTALGLLAVEGLLANTWLRRVP